MAIKKPYIFLSYRNENLIMNLHAILNFVILLWLYNIFYIQYVLLFDIYLIIIKLIKKKIIYIVVQISLNISISHLHAMDVKVFNITYKLERTILNMWTNYPMKAILFLSHGQDQEIWMDIEHLPHYESHLMFKWHLFPGTWTLKD